MLEVQPAPHAHSTRTRCARARARADARRNIVATVNLECRLDLKTIALHARNAEFNPKVSQVLVLGLSCPEGGGATYHGCGTSSSVGSGASAYLAVLLIPHLSILVHLLLHAPRTLLPFPLSPTCSTHNKPGSLANAREFSSDSQPS